MSNAHTQNPFPAHPGSRNCPANALKNSLQNPNTAIRNSGLHLFLVDDLAFHVGNDNVRIVGADIDTDQKPRVRSHFQRDWFSADHRGDGGRLNDKVSRNHLAHDAGDESWT